MDISRFQEEDFNSLLFQIIEGDHLEPVALGITKLVIDKGFESLTLSRNMYLSMLFNTIIMINVRDVEMKFLGAKCIYQSFITGNAVGVLSFLIMINKIV